MRKILLFAFCIVLTSCGSVAITGRSQLLLFSDGEIASLSEQSYKEVVSTMGLSANQKYAADVREVGNKLIAAITEYMRINNTPAVLNGFNWSFDVAKSEEINAFCLPSGRIVFYEGIMKIFKNKDEIAFVMGHEIAHAIAKHGNERMSQQAVTGMVGEIASEVIGAKSSKNQAIFDVAFGLGAQYGLVLPYSRKHEYEADKLGMIFMAMAGYNIEAVPAFWETMSQGKGASGSDFFSTHPSDANRIANMKKEMAEAKKYMPNK